MKVDLSCSVLFQVCLSFCFSARYHPFSCISIRSCTRGNNVQIAHFLKPLTQSPTPPVRTSFRSVYTPILCAESDGAIHFLVSSLVVEGEAKTFPISHFANDNPQTPSSTVSTSLKNVYTPIRCAESNGTIHFPASSLVIQVEAKTSKIRSF